MSGDPPTTAGPPADQPDVSSLPRLPDFPPGGSIDPMPGLPWAGRGWLGVVGGITVLAGLLTVMTVVGSLM